MASHNYFHTTLVENHPYHDYVEAGAINYYKFNLKNVDKVTELKFEVTGLHGELTLFSSSTEEYPDIDKNDHVSFWNSISYSKNNKKKVNGNNLKEGFYFLGI
jgi:hypothetical protein